MTKTTPRIETLDNAARLLDILQVAGVRWYKFGRDKHPFDLIGSIQQIKPDVDDVFFTIVHGPDYEPFHNLPLSQCDVAPLVDGRVDYEFSFTISKDNA